MTATMLQKWGFDGYVRWLRGIKATYRMRKNWMCDTFEDVFHLEFDENINGLKTNDAVRDIFDGMGRGVTCYAKQIEGSKEALWDEKRGHKSKRGPPLVSFIPPSAGMFVFLAVHICDHPDYQALVEKGEDATKFLMDSLWRQLAENLVRLTNPSALTFQVLFAPGWGFDAHGPHAIGGDGIGYFRLSYSIATYEQTRTAIETFARILTKFYRLK